MVGVSSPLFKARGAKAFHSGLAVGVMVSAMVLSLALTPVSVSFASAVPVDWRLLVVVVLATCFGLLDLTNRTPGVARQVPQPQRLGDLTHGRLGIAYGIDIGLHFTTQKTTSLLWVAIAGSVVLGRPELVIAVLITAAVVYTLTISTLSMTDQRAITNFTFWGWRASKWIRLARALAATILLSGAAIVTASLAW